MKFLKKAGITASALFLTIVAIYWFNLDTKAVKAIEPMMIRHYDNLERSRSI